MNKFNVDDLVVVPQPTMVGKIRSVITISPPQWKQDEPTSYRYEVFFPSIKVIQTFDEEQLKNSNNDN